MTELMGIALGLGSAACWGAADFNGGLASKRVNVLTVLATAHFIGACLLALVALLLRDPVPPLAGIGWAVLSGMAGLIGLVALYRGLATGRMGLVAPVAGLVTGLIPVSIGMLTAGVPAVPRLLGFALALLAVWMIARTADTNVPPPKPVDFVLPVVAGLGFGFAFVLLDRMAESGVLWPLVAMRLVSLMTLLAVGAFSGGLARPTSAALLPIALAGILDTSGNALFALATLAGRLDVAAVLSSLYPAVTVLLAWAVLKERISLVQGLGVALALVAVLLISA